MHFSVMAAESLELLAVRPDGIYLDATTGLGGHTALIAARLERGFVIANDRDAQSLEMARQNTLELAERIRFRHATFGMLAETVRSEGFEKVDGLLADLGVSRYQLTAPERGFSFLMDGPLDMRMDPTLDQSAADWLAAAGEEYLVRILNEYGEERHARRMARAVMAARDEGRLGTTRDLARVAEKVLGRPPRGQVHPATRLFQALRLAVNAELEALEAGLPSLARLLAPGGRMAVISFHSLEDRLVKDFFRRESTDCICPPGLPECRCGHKAWLRALTHKPLGAASEETDSNPRSRSAKLRCAERI